MTLTPFINENAFSSDLHVKNLNSQQWLMLAQEIAHRNTIVFTGQDLSASEFVDCIRNIGNMRRRDYFFNHPSCPEITLVTNQRDAEGRKQGVFADLELGWHSNGNTRSDSEAFLALYCVAPGVGGETWFSHGQRSYADLSPDLKALVEEIECEYEFDPSRPDTFYKIKPEDPEYRVFTGEADRINGRETRYGRVCRPLVSVHPFSNKKSLYFSYPTLSRWWRRDGKGFNEKELWSFLKNHMFQDKYVYKHQWKKGDLIFNDQLSGFHRRTEVSSVETRQLYRIAFDFNNHVLDYL